MLPLSLRSFRWATGRGGAGEGQGGQKESVSRAGRSAGPGAPARPHVCMHTELHVCTQTCTHTDTRARGPANTHVCTWTFTCVHTQVRTQTCTDTHTHTRAHGPMHTHMHADLCTWTLHVCVHTQPLLVHAHRHVSVRACTEILSTHVCTHRAFVHTSVGTQSLHISHPYECTDRQLVHLHVQCHRRTCSFRSGWARRGARLLSCGRVSTRTHRHTHMCTHRHVPAPCPALALTVAHALQEILEGFGQLAGLRGESTLS